jgi:hypothetical protein
MKKWICKILLPYISRLENKLWRIVYVKKVDTRAFNKHLMPNKDDFSNCVVRDDKDYT